MCALGRAVAGPRTTLLVVIEIQKERSIGVVDSLHVRVHFGLRRLNFAVAFNKRTDSSHAMNLASCDADCHADQTRERAECS